MSQSLLRWMIALPLAVLTVAMLPPPAARAEPIAGLWHGALKLPAAELRLVVRVTPASGGGYGGQLVSVDQGEATLPLADVHAADGAFSFTVPTINARYEGHWDGAAHAWAGVWTQGAAIPLTLAPGDAPAGPAVAGLDGTWNGALPTPTGGQLRLVLHVRSGHYGASATLDSPDQLAKGIPIRELTREGQAVRFTVPAVGGAYSGTLSADGQTLTGSWSQGASQPLTFTRGAVEAVRNRPQTPRPPFPYRSEEVTAQSAPGVVLAGTLTLPVGPGPFPAVVLITGSGPQDRDETLLGHKPFAVLADDLTRRGIAVLRMDDRGVGKSTGSFATAVTTDFAVDAEAGARLLRARPDIDPHKVGLIGHSEGGLVAPMVAARDPQIAFLVLMAGPAAPMNELMDAQRLALAPGMGLDPDAARRMNAAFAVSLAAMKDATDTADAQARARAALAAMSPPLPARQIDVLTAQISSPWFRQLMGYDPQPALRALRIPVLALNGAKDRQVPAAQNLPLMRAALAADPDATVVELPGLNHLFQTAPTGAVGEYEDIEETLSPLALDTIGAWVVAHTR